MAKDPKESKPDRKPQVGDVVLFQSRGTLHLARGVITCPQRAALVTGIHPDGRIDVSLFNTLRNEPVREVEEDQTAEKPGTWAFRK